VPERCPECGRFLSRGLVQSLLAEPAPCPRCASTLTAEMFHGSDALVHAPEPLAESVRPPDLPPGSVREPEERDVLAGWDLAPEPTERRTTITAPLTAAAAIIGAGVVGGLIGGLSARRHRSAASVVGTLVGAGIAIAGARVLDVPITPATS
jgi:hypothetical protein